MGNEPLCYRFVLPSRGNLSHKCLFHIQWPPMGFSCSTLRESPAYQKFLCSMTPTFAMMLSHWFLRCTCRTLLPSVAPGRRMRSLRLFNECFCLFTPFYRCNRVGWVCFGWLSSTSAFSLPLCGPHYIPPPAWEIVGRFGTTVRIEDSYLCVH